MDILINESIRTAKGEILYDDADIKRKAALFRNRPRVFKPWDVYWSAVKFEDDPKYSKIRPVIVLGYEDKNTLSIICCSTKEKTGRYCIVDHLNMGLVDKTFVVYDKVESISTDKIFEPTNKPLSKKDQKEISRLMMSNKASEKLISEKETVSMRRLKEDDTIRIGNREYRNSVVDNGETEGRKIDLSKERSKTIGKKVLDAIKAISGYKDDPLSVMFDELVPNEGKADTVAGEIVRAMNHILYRWSNDGDKFYDNNGFNSNAASAAAYVMDKTETTGQFMTIAEDGFDGEEYNDAILTTADDVVEYLENHHELFVEFNEENYADYDASVFDEDDTYVFEMGSDVVDRIDRGIMSKSDVYDFIEGFCMDYINRYPKKIKDVMDGYEIECTARERDILDQNFYREYDAWLEEYPLEDEEDYDDEDLEESVRHRATSKNGSWEEMNVLN